VLLMDDCVGVYWCWCVLVLVCVDVGGLLVFFGVGSVLVCVDMMDDSVCVC
jgi:hypothetical protein